MITSSFTQKVSQLKEKEVSERLMKEVSEELNLPLHMVKEVIVKGQSKFTAHVMKSDTFDGVRWPFLGKFTAKVKAAQVLKHIKGLTAIQKEFFFSQKEFQKFKNKFRTNGKIST